MKSDIEKTSVRCNTCAADNYQIVAVGREHEYENTTDDKFPLVRCQECGHLYLNPRPAVSELGTIYPPNYYAYELLKYASDKGGWFESFFRKINFERFSKLARLVMQTHKERYRVLDVGCSDGRYLSIMAEAFEGRADTVGVEMNKEAAAVAVAAGHEVYASRIEDTELVPKSFDLVYSFHVIEHVADPRAFLVALGESLCPDGLLVIDTPNVDTIDYRLFSKSGHWGGFHFPRHWNLYDPVSFSKLADSCGFEVVETEYYANYVFWIWTCHSLFRGWLPGAKRLFPTVHWYKSTPWNLCLFAFFTAVELFTKLLTGKTACMRITLKARNSRS